MPDQWRVWYLFPHIFNASAQNKRVNEKLSQFNPFLLMRLSQIWKSFSFRNSSSSFSLRLLLWHTHLTSAAPEQQNHPISRIGFANEVATIMTQQLWSILSRYCALLGKKEGAAVQRSRCVIWYPDNKNHSCFLHLHPINKVECKAGEQDDEKKRTKAAKGSCFYSLPVCLKFFVFCCANGSLLGDRGFSPHHCPLFENTHYCTKRNWVSWITWM